MFLSFKDIKYQQPNSQIGNNNNTALTEINNNLTSSFTYLWCAHFGYFFTYMKRQRMFSTECRAEA